MNIIQSGQKYLAILGVCPHKSLTNAKFLFAMTVYAINVSGNCIFLFYVADTFFEYANSIFLTTTITTAAVCFIIMALEKTLIFTAINLFEELIQKSKYIKSHIFQWLSINTGG